MALWLAGYSIFDSELDHNRQPDISIVNFCQRDKKKDRSREVEYVDYFYEKYQGRVSLEAGYDQNFSQIYPFIFQDAYGRSIGVVAMGISCAEKNAVHLYHIGSFITRKGDGSLILAELCRKADCFNIRLSASPVYMPNGRDPQMDYGSLSEWYNRFDFTGDPNLLRRPRNKRTTA